MSIEQTKQKSIYLQGHTCKENAYEVKDYPWGFRQRTSIFYWIETKPGKGDRFCSYTINPKTGSPCAPKCSTYSTFMYMYLDENNHVKHGIIDAYDREQFEARFEFIMNKLDVLYITDAQRQNIRTNHCSHIIANAPYQLKRYTPEKQPVFKQWVKNTLKHIQTCEFTELINYSPKPDYDNE